MRIGYLGAGTWGLSLANLLATKGHEVIVWAKNPEFVDHLTRTRQHPKLRHFTIHESVSFTSDLAKALDGAEVIVESVTCKGVRPVFTEVKKLIDVQCPIILTSKGIEPKTCLLLNELLLEILGEKKKSLIGCLSGPSHAEEVTQNLPTSIVCSAYDPKVMLYIQELFNTPVFRVYPNSDINGVLFGGAMKNIIAIACGISDGLGFGDNTKAALMTRGLHEIRKLCVAKGCNPETLTGLAGLGDLCVTCLSDHSRNRQFGLKLAKGFDSYSAQENIGMVVEGVHTCISALELSKKAQIPVPITEAIYNIVYNGLNPKDAVKALLQRTIKEENL